MSYITYLSSISYFWIIWFALTGSSAADGQGAQPQMFAILRLLRLAPEQNTLLVSLIGR
jgi:hypothetical protein